MIAPNCPKFSCFSRTTSLRKVNWIKRKTFRLYKRPMTPFSIINKTYSITSSNSTIIQAALTRKFKRIRITLNLTTSIRMRQIKITRTVKNQRLKVRLMGLLWTPLEVLVAAALSELPPLWSPTTIQFRVATTHKMLVARSTTINSSTSVTTVHHHTLTIFSHLLIWVTELLTQYSRRYHHLVTWEPRTSWTTRRRRTKL